MRTFLMTLAMVVSAQLFGQTPIFQSGFENTVALIPASNPDRVEITGADSAPIGAVHWQLDLENNPELGGFDQFIIKYYSSDPTDPRTVSLVTDPDPAQSDTALRYWIGECYYEQSDKRYGKLQGIYANNNVKTTLTKTGFKKLHYSVDLFIPESWEDVEISDPLNITQVWNDGGWEGDDNAFRIILEIIKDAGSDKFGFYTKGQIRNAGAWVNPPEWDATSAKIYDIGTWQTLEFTIKEGLNDKGLFKLEIDDGTFSDVVFEIEDDTYKDSPSVQPDGISDVDMMLMYVRQSVLDKFDDENVDCEFFWDNFKIYDDSELRKKYFKLIEADCDSTRVLTPGDMILTTQTIPGVGDPGNNWKYRFRFQDPTGVAPTFVVKSDTTASVDMTQFINDELKNNTAYRVRTSIQNHPFLNNYGGSNDSFCYVTTSGFPPPLSFRALELTLVPNPLNSEALSLYVKGLGPDKSAKIEIQDMYGRRIYEQAVIGKEDVNSINLSVNRATFSRGFYFVTIQNDQKRIVKKLWVE